MRTSFPSRTNAGFTLIEVLAVISILGILSMLIFAGYPRFLASAQKAKCMSNLRGLHHSFSSYVTDVGNWPQVPDFETSENQAYENWWIEMMLPHGVSREMWICPTIRKAQESLPSRERSYMHYTPTEFDAKPITPRLWPTMPWFVEIANAHGQGALIIFADGSIEPGDRFFPQ
jgi:prepilin-type N-terminal cleavage/methylation domain-containing protein